MSIDWWSRSTNYFLTDERLTLVLNDSQYNGSPTVAKFEYNKDKSLKKYQFFPTNKTKTPTQTINLEDKHLKFEFVCKSGEKIIGSYKIDNRDD
jgi:hypothetical protein